MNHLILKLMKNCSISYKGDPIYVGIDVHKKSWSVAIYSELGSLRKFRQDADPIVLKNYLERYFPEAKFILAYEAGFCGFTPQRKLESLGLNCMVVNPADVPTMDKERRVKTDKVDCTKLAKCLRAGQLRANFVPTVQQEAHRQLLRARYHAERDLRKSKNRIRSIITRFGFTELEGHRWSKKFIRLLEEHSIEDETMQSTWALYLEGLKMHMDAVKQYDHQILNLSRQKGYASNCELLRSIPGVGTLSAMTLLVELIDINRFKSLDELCSYVGLVPNVNQSGEKDRSGRITSRGNKYIKYVLIECAWRARSADPSLLFKYEQLCKRMKSNQAIVRVAKSLLSRMRAVLKNQTPYRMN